MVKRIIIGILCVMVIFISGCTDVEHYNDYFFKNVDVYQFSGRFSALSEPFEEREVELIITEIHNLKEGILYELKINANEEIRDCYQLDRFSVDRLNLGYFFVQEEQIFLIREEFLRVKQMTAEELVSIGTLVCQEEEKADVLGTDEQGWHECIAVDGNRREYHSYNDLAETGFYEHFVWENGKGLVAYKSGYGAEADDIELYYKSLDGNGETSEMIDFFRLYVSDFAFKNNSLEIVLIILFVNIFIYLLDFYNLVKRKSKAETLAIMGVPLVVSAIGSVLMVTAVNIPDPGHLDPFVEVLTEPEVCLQLCFIVGIYVILWLITYFSQKKRLRKDVRKWIISCVLDYCFALGIILGTVCRFCVGIHFFTISNQIFLWLYAYCILFLSCKVILFIVGNLVRLYSLRITIFRWTESKNPASFLARYFYFYQSAILRNAILFELGLLVPLTVIISDYGWDYEMSSMLLFLYLGAVLVVAVSIAPVRERLNCFARWGGSEKSKRLFCQEYFTEEALYKDDNFTITRHFLVLEQRPADVYYWPYLKNVSDWIFGEEGKYRELVFSDGKACRFTPEEVGKSEEIFQYAHRHMEVNSLYNS